MAQSFQNHGFEFPRRTSFVPRSDVSLVKAIDPEACDLEGKATRFPDTYGLPRHASAAQLVSQMVGRFNQVFGGDLKAPPPRRTSGSRRRHAPPIVEKETARGRTLHGRGGVSEPAADLQWGCSAIPTAIYALQKAGATRQSHAREPAVRLALQHVPLRGPAAGSHRAPGPRLTRGRTQSCVRWITSTSSAATTARTSSRRPTTSSGRTCRTFQVGPVTRTTRACRAVFGFCFRRVARLRWSEHVPNTIEYEHIASSYRSPQCSFCLSVSSSCGRARRRGAACARRA